MFPALSAAGLSATEVRQSEAALREGKWKIGTLLCRYRCMANAEPAAKPVQIEGWQPLLIDWVGFFRLHLKGCTSSHYASEAGKALPAVELGMVAVVQDVSDSQVCERVRCIPQLRALNRTGETGDLLTLAKAEQKKDCDVVVHKYVNIVADRPVKVSHLETAGIRHFVIRRQQNLSARRSEPPAQQAGKRGRPATRGLVVRPIERRYKDKVLPATPANREETFKHPGQLLQAKWFEHLHGLP